jgi:hypothetical protein
MTDLSDHDINPGDHDQPTEVITIDRHAHFTVPAV